MFIDFAYRCKALLLSAFAAVALTSPSYAVTLVDTFLPNNTSNGSIFVGFNPFVPISQSIGLRFEVAEQATATDILLALGGAGTFQVGIQASTSTANGVVPSSTFLHSVFVTDPTSNLSISGIDWKLSPGTYYLVATGVGAVGGNWGYGQGGSTVATVNNSPWFFPQVNPVAASINAVPVPEASSALMLLCGLALVVLLRRHPLTPLRSVA